jgi:hypothetical protein
MSNVLRLLSVGLVLFALAFPAFRQGDQHVPFSIASTLPEPYSIALVSAGLYGLASLLRRHFRSQAADTRPASADRNASVRIGPIRIAQAADRHAEVPRPAPGRISPHMPAAVKRQFWDRDRARTRAS